MLRLYHSLISLFLLLPLFGAAQQDAVMPYAPELFPPNVSSGVCGFSSDGRIIYFVQEDTVVKKLFLYQATKAGKVWGHVNLLPFSGKHNDSGGRPMHRKLNSLIRLLPKFRERSGLQTPDQQRA